MSLAATTPAGSASVQGELWGVRARDYAEIQEPTFLPLYESVMERPEMAKAHSFLTLDVGRVRGAGISRTIAHVAGADATAPFIEIARRRAPRGDFRTAEMEALRFADGTFDAVTGFNSFQYAASPANVLCEARRVVKRWRYYRCGLGLARRLRRGRASEGLWLADAVAATRRSGPVHTIRRSQAQGARRRSRPHP